MRLGSFIHTVARLRCPGCGDGRLFSGWLKTHRQCPACGLSLAKLDAEDGPAAFAILILGAINTGLAIAIEIIWRPSLWVFVIVFTVALVPQALWLLRHIKAFFMACGHRYNVRQKNL